MWDTNVINPHRLVMGYVLRKLISVDLFQDKPRKGFEKLNLLAPIKFNLAET
jgi:hypothetical protein